MWLVISLMSFSLFNRSQITRENSLRHTRAKWRGSLNSAGSMSSMPEKMRDKSFRLKM